MRPRADPRMLSEIGAPHLLSYRRDIKQKPSLAAPASDPQTPAWGALMENILLRLLGSQSVEPKRLLDDRLTSSSPIAWRNSLRQLTTHPSASALVRDWG